MLFWQSRTPLKKFMITPSVILQSQVMCMISSNIFHFINCPVVQLSNGLLINVLIKHVGVGPRQNQPS